MKFKGLSRLLFFLAFVLTALYAWYIWIFYSDFMETHTFAQFRLMYILNTIHIVAVALAVLCLLVVFFISLALKVNKEQTNKATRLTNIGGGFLLVAMLTGLRHYIFIYVSPPLYRAFLLLIPILIYAISAFGKPLQDC